MLDPRADPEIPIPELLLSDTAHQQALLIHGRSTPLGHQLSAASDILETEGGNCGAQGLASSRASALKRCCAQVVSWASEPQNHHSSVPGVPWGLRPICRVQLWVTQQWCPLCAPYGHSIGWATALWAGPVPTCALPAAAEGTCHLGEMPCPATAWTLLIWRSFRLGSLSS